jgi:serine/threonine-protein kinase
MDPTVRAGRFELIEPIASGGMATVWLGRIRGARGFERHVAIKAMHPHLAQDPDFVAMFLDEARMASCIHHPNVVPTLDVAEDDQGLLLVLELVDGLPLNQIQRAVARTQLPIPVPVALRIELDLLAGLHAAHELMSPDGTLVNLVHRDVSPQNVLVGSDGVARITDFGIARAEIRIATTRTGQSKGKIPYMSPEQINSEPIDRRSDLFGAGAVLWEMLTGQRLFHGDSEASVLHRVLAGEIKRPSELRAAVPKAIDAVCLRALARPRDERFATAAQFAEALESAAKQAGVVVASARDVAQLVKELGPAVRPRGIPPAPTSQSGSMSRPRAEAPAPAGNGTGGTAVTAFASIPKPRGSRWRVVAAAALGSLVTAAVAYLATRSEDAPPGPSAVVSAPAALVNGAPAASASAASTTPVESTSAPPSANAPTPVEASAAPSAAPAVPTGPRTARPPPTVMTSKPFRPEEP